MKRVSKQCYYSIIMFALLLNHAMHGVTLVYNLRVRRVFNIPLILEKIRTKTDGRSL